MSHVPNPTFHVPHPITFVLNIVLFFFPSDEGDFADATAVSTAVFIATDTTAVSTATYATEITATDEGTTKKKKKRKFVATDRLTTGDSSDDGITKKKKRRKFVYKVGEGETFFPGTQQGVADSDPLTDLWMGGSSSGRSTGADVTPQLSRDATLGLKKKKNGRPKGSKPSEKSKVMFCVTPVCIFDSTCLFSILVPTHFHSSSLGCVKIVTRSQPITV
jgi:hypothetical protein